MSGAWMTGGVPTPGSTRLFCFPFAGGSASAYRPWFRLAPSTLHVNSVEYPGRGMRMAETPSASLPQLVLDLADRIEPLLTSPFSFFGHSMGGVVAYELTRELRARGAALPQHLFVSAASAPGGPTNHRALIDVTDAEVVEELRQLGGTPPELLDQPEIVSQAVRVLRADSIALGTYHHRSETPLDVPVTAFGGRDDQLVGLEHLCGWSTLTTGAFRLALFPGDHFFLYPAGREILAAIALSLDRLGVPNPRDPSDGAPAFAFHEAGRR